MAYLADESEQLNSARSNSGGYADRHFPSVLYDYYRDSMTISLFSIAADGLEYVFPLAKLNASADMSIPHVGAGLVEWNAIGHAKSPDPITASELLATWLEYRIHPESGGRLHDFLERCGADENDTGLCTAGTVYPNPLAFCLTDCGEVNIYPLLGQQHGDCHGYNILLRQQHEMANPDYYLIDFALYQPRWPIFYDHAYLELSLLLDYTESFEERRWDAFLTYCGKRPAEADKTLLRPEDKTYVSIIRKLRNTVEEWIGQKYRAIHSSAESQVRLARVAAGLNFANKASLEPTRRYKALIYAAHQLKEYCRFKQFPLPETGVTSRARP